MTKKKQIKELDGILELIETDRYTMENIIRLTEEVKASDSGLDTPRLISELARISNENEADRFTSENIYYLIKKLQKEKK